MANQKTQSINLRVSPAVVRNFDKIVGRGNRSQSICVLMEAVNQHKIAWVKPTPAKLVEVAKPKKS